MGILERRCMFCHPMREYEFRFQVARCRLSFLRLFGGGSEFPCVIGRDVLSSSASLHLGNFALYRSKINQQQPGSRCEMFHAASFSLQCVSRILPPGGETDHEFDVLKIQLLG